MSRPKPEFDELLRSHPRDSRHEPAEHPAPEELAAYHDGRLPPERDAAVREHLVSCEGCGAIVLELATLGEEPEEPARGTADFAAAAAWRRQRRRLREHQLLPAAGPRIHRAWLVAAALALVSLGLGSWVTSLKQTVDELRRPQVDPPLVSLSPLGAERDPAAAPDSVTLPPGARAWLILNLAGNVELAAYRADFVDSDGHMLWMLEGLRGTRAGSLRLELPGDLSAGEVRILLSGPGGPEPEPIAEYRLRIVRP